MRERGIQDRLLQHYLISKGQTEQPSIIDVSVMTVAPILVLLAGAYVIGIFLLVVESCAHGNILKYWPRGIGRRPWIN